MKNTTLIKKYAFHSFKDEKTFERWLQTQYHGHFLTGFKHYKKSLDCIAVKGILFTIDEYDGEGRTLSWGNKKKDKNLIVETTNRYRQGYNDAKVELFSSVYGFRNDINYIQ